jgi:hypothetical protein
LGKTALDSSGIPYNNSDFALTAVCIAGVERMQFLAGLETDRLARRDADFGASTRVAANSGFAGTDAENAKPAQFDALTSGKGLLETLEDRIYCGLDLGAGKARALDYIMDNVLFDQCGNLAAEMNSR